ncbi:MAG TPA: glycoside hydrolase family 43 protein [Bacteroidales bacterium]|nr:glycoside hydrolase family 43 protein [Bacteroidales bacterium]HPF01868.1 glycoside hydrolase family 43 protein [Bacteroidales bacterium]HPJ58237.1 glycoside hydrolase family 43 protein [Bacteroidales bacterium]HPR11568.1 glycoside hydrolase family 43 protein [Bacteroidales bacterium]HRW84310.1 glycoside hydrolase family 43 protein [Bacteroidales bacterium]
MRRAIFLFLILPWITATGLAQEFRPEFNVPLGNINLSDPFIYADGSDQTYYMYGSGGNGMVMARASKDLKLWTDRFVVYRFPDDHWAGNRASCWAAEVHKYKGKYYLFTTSDDRTPMGKNARGDDYPRRATQIYVADSPGGPFRDFTNNQQHTPREWPALDGTLWVENGKPYMIFCREWLQTMNGTMEAVRLPEDLGVPKAKPFTLFTGFDAPYITDKEPEPKTAYVTDGCFVFRTQTGRLGMIWSSWKGDDYVLMAAYSESGRIKGPWVQDKELLFESNGGHGMLFRTFDGRLMLSMHYVDPNDARPTRQPMFIEVDDSGDRLVFKAGGLVLK